MFLFLFLDLLVFSKVHGARHQHACTSTLLFRLTRLGLRACQGPVSRRSQAAPDGLVYMYRVLAAAVTVTRSNYTLTEHVWRASCHGC